MSPLVSITEVKVKEDMTSRERTLAAINHQEPDRVPIFLRDIVPLEHLWKDRFERVDVLLKMGVDEKVRISVDRRIRFADIS